ncbi:unknown [Firmicutes bacterium CAG:345]|jgi:hypothetical protein|nr:unknown [Firmicutes bacterium CAG:345]
MKKELLDEQMVKVEGGEALTLSAVLSVLVIGIVAVMCYRIFMSEKGNISLPGGYKFSWGK